MGVRMYVKASCAAATEVDFPGSRSNKYISTP